MLLPMPITIEMIVTSATQASRWPPEKSISTAENLRPRPASTMPPIMMPSVPIAAPAEVLLWAPPTSALSTAAGPMRVALCRQDSAAAATVPQNAP